MHRSRIINRLFGLTRANEIKHDHSTVVYAVLAMFREHHFCFLPRFTTVDWEGWSTSHFDQRQQDDLNFHITNFPFLSSNIQSSPAYGVFISQLIRYARACSSYECFILRARRLSSKLLKHGYLAERLKSSFRKFYGRYGGLIQQIMKYPSHAC